MLHNAALHWVSNYKCRQYWTWFRNRSILLDKGEVLTAILFVTLTSERNMTVSTNRCCQQHEMSVRTLAVVFVGMAVVGVVRSSRLPLVVFQHHHNHHHHVYDEQDIQQLEETTAPAGDYHHLPHFHHFNDDRGIRVLYQVGVSKIFELLRLHDWLQHPLAMRSQSRKSESLLCLSAHVTTRKRL